MAAQFLRKKIIEAARKEAAANVVFAKNGGGVENGKTTRKGYERLLAYFSVCLPDPKRPGKTVINEDAIKYLTNPGKLAPCPHWCGIFALYILRTVGMNVGTWKIGNGISAVSGMRVIPKTTAGPGDVGFINNGFEHHVIIEEVFEEGGIKKVRTIEGNSDPNSNFNFKTRALSEFASTYTAFSG